MREAGHRVPLSTHPYYRSARYVWLEANHEDSGWCPGQNRDCRSHFEVQLSHFICGQGSECANQTKSL